MIGVVFRLRCIQILVKLLQYPNGTTGRTPSEQFLKHQIRTRLGLLKPNISETITHNQSQQKYHYDKQTKMHTFEVSEHVLVQNIRGAPKWLPGVIVGTTGNMSYKIRNESQIWNRHVDQLWQGTTSPTTSRSSSLNISTDLTEGLVISQEVADTQNTSETDNYTTFLSCQRQLVHRYTWSPDTPAELGGFLIVLLQHSD